jgi:hypothetical protein
MSAFEHLAYAVGRHYDEALFAMMTCYFDEAIEGPWNDDVGKPHEFTFMCGYVGNFEQWQQFAVEWRKFLDGYGIEDFHMTDYCASSGEFRKWKPRKFEPTRIAFMMDASRIVKQFVRYGFIAGLSQSAFDEANQSYALKETFGSPYGVAGRACAELARSRRPKFYPDETELEYVYEDGAEGKGGLEHGMTKLIPAFPYPIFKPGKSQKPSREYPDGRKAVLQLQAADYLAYEIRKLFADQVKIDPIRNVRLSFKALTPIPTVKQLFTGKELQSMCKELGVERRN